MSVFRLWYTDASMASFASNYIKRTFTSLAILNYRLYFFGQALSMSGTWMQTVALGWLVLVLTGSGTTLGLVLAAQFGPMLFLGPWGGVIADRFDKRTILYCTHGAFALISFAVSVLIFTDAIVMWM